MCSVARSKKMVTKLHGTIIARKPLEMYANHASFLAFYGT